MHPLTALHMLPLRSRSKAGAACKLLQATDLVCKACTFSLRAKRMQTLWAMQAGLKDIESASRLAWKYMMDSGDLLRGLEARQAFLDFMELMSTGHPIPR